MTPARMKKLRALASAKPGTCSAAVLELLDALALARGDFDGLLEQFTATTEDMSPSQKAMVHYMERCGRRERERDDAQTMLAAVQEQCADTERTLEAARAQLREVTGERDRLQRTLDDKQIMVDGSIGAIAELRAELEESEATETAARAEAARLRDDLITAQALLADHNIPWPAAPEAQQRCNCGNAFDRSVCRIHGTAYALAAEAAGTLPDPGPLTPEGATRILGAIRAQASEEELGVPQPGGEDG